MSKQEQEWTKETQDLYDEARATAEVRGLNIRWSRLGVTVATVPSPEFRVRSYQPVEGTPAHRLGRLVMPRGFTTEQKEQGIELLLEGASLIPMVD